MQFSRTGIVWIPPGNNAATARRTRTGRKVGIGVFNSLAGQLIDIRGFDRRIAIATQVVPANVIANNDDKIGSGGLGLNFKKCQ